MQRISAKFPNQVGQHALPIQSAAGPPSQATARPMKRHMMKPTSSKCAANTAMASPRCPGPKARYDASHTAIHTINANSVPTVNCQRRLVSNRFAVESQS